MGLHRVREAALGLGSPVACGTLAVAGRLQKEGVAVGMLIRIEVLHNRFWRCALWH